MKIGQHSAPELLESAKTFKLGAFQSMACKAVGHGGGWDQAGCHESRET